MKYTLIVATVMALATPALAEEVGCWRRRRPRRRWRNRR
jgi:hypothetical protein